MTQTNRRPSKATTKFTKLVNVQLPDLDAEWPIEPVKLLEIMPQLVAAAPKDIHEVAFRYYEKQESQSISGGTGIPLPGDALFYQKLRIFRQGIAFLFRLVRNSPDVVRFLLVVFHGG